MEQNTFLQQDGDDFERRLLQEVANDAPKPGTLRMKVPSTWMFFWYEVGLGFATTLAFLVFLLVSVGDFFVWLFNRHSRRKGVQDCWQKVHWAFTGFKVYHAVWKLTLQVKSQRGFVDIPVDSYIRPFAKASERVGDALSTARDTLELMDPFEVLVTTVVTFEAGFIVYAIGLLIWLALPAGIVATQLHFTAPPQVAKPFQVPSYQLSEIQQQEKNFGPWFDENGVTQLREKRGVNNIALLSDTGDARYSKKWTINPADKAWSASSSPWVTQSELQGTGVTFKDRRRNTFYLNVNQPFSFENYAFEVFYFDAAGNLHQAPKNDVTLVPLSTVPSTAASNAQLSR